VYSALFEDIIRSYHKNNVLKNSEVKIRLFEQILREMGAFTPKDVAKKFYEALQRARERISDSFGINARRNANTTYNRGDDDQHLETAVNETIEAGKGTIDNPLRSFRMKIDGNIVIKHTDHPELANNFVVNLETTANSELKDEFKNSIEGWICRLLLLLPKDSKNKEGLYKIKEFSLKSIFETWKKCYDEILKS